MQTFDTNIYDVIKGKGYNNKPILVLRKYYGDPKKVIIPEGINKIESYAFSLKEVEELFLPSTLRCFEPDDTDFSNIKKNLKVFYNMTLEKYIKLDAPFYLLNMAKDIYIKRNGKYICLTKEKEITIPNRITHINECFTNFRNLEKVIFSDSVKSLFNTFRCCFSLKTVILNEGLISIDECAFTDCTSLKEISIPSTVKYIGNCAFRYCPKLRKVEFKSKELKIDNEAFIENDEMLINFVYLNN